MINTTNSINYTTIVLESMNWWCVSVKEVFNTFELIKDINSCSTLFCNWILVFTTQIGLLKVTAVAPAKILLLNAFNVGDMLGKCFSRNGFEDSYLTDHKYPNSIYTRKWIPREGATLRIINYKSTFAITHLHHILSKGKRNPHFEQHFSYL